MIERLLQAAELLVEHEQAVFAAVLAVRQSRAEFADALIAALAANAGCATTLSFDRKASRLQGVTLLH